jgi:two-component system, NarL family, nitrate/nitrite response regulator NarL
VRRLVSTVVLDENTLLREGLKRVLSESRFRIVKDGSTKGHISLGEIPQRIGGLLFLIGADENPWELASQVRRLKGAYPHAVIVVLGEQTDVRPVLGAINAGASGYLNSTMMRDILIKTLELIMLGETVVPTPLLQAICDRAQPTTPAHSKVEDVCAPTSPALITDRGGDIGKHARRPFSMREAAVLNSLRRGESNKSIARTLQIAEATVKVHVKAILRKINAKNRTQAALWAATQDVGPFAK